MNNYLLPALSYSKKNIKTILFFIALYLFFLIITLPAKVALSAINFPANVKITSVSGTFWSGNAGQLSISNIDFGSVSWEIHPLHFFIGELSADVSIVNGKQYIITEVDLSPSGQIELEDTRFLIDLSMLQPLTYGMPFSYAGNISGYFPASSLYKDNHIEINGKLSLSNIEMISPQRESIGNFVIDFRSENEGSTSGKIKDTDGLLNIAGKLLLAKDGQFNISAKLKVRESGSSLEKVLLFLGKKDAGGRIQLNSHFNLWN